MEDIYTNQDLDALCSLTEKDFTPVVKEKFTYKKKPKLDFENEKAHGKSRCILRRWCWPLMWGRWLN